MSVPRDIDALLRAEPADAGCDAGFAVFHVYVERELAGFDVASEFPGVAAHLRACPACREDHRGMVEAVRRFGGGGHAAP